MCRLATLPSGGFSGSVPAAWHTIALDRRLREHGTGQDHYADPDRFEYRLRRLPHGAGVTVGSIQDAGLDLLAV
jgi:hypothetical protein